LKLYADYHDAAYRRGRLPTAGRRCCTQAMRIRIFLVCLLISHAAFHKPVSSSPTRQIARCSVLSSRTRNIIFSINWESCLFLCALPGARILRVSSLKESPCLKPPTRPVRREKNRAEDPPDGEDRWISYMDMLLRPWRQRPDLVSSTLHSFTQNTRVRGGNPTFTFVDGSVALPQISGWGSLLSKVLPPTCGPSLSGSFDLRFSP